MTTVEVLKAARAKIEQGWCQGDAAQNSDGELCGSQDLNASCWCCVGAIGAVTAYNEQATPALKAIRDAIGTPGIAKWNDAKGRTQAEVLAAFDKAIELAEKQ